MSWLIFGHWPLAIRRLQALQVPVADEEVHAGAPDPFLLEVTGDLFGYRHGAVLTTGAAYAEREVRLPFGGVARDEEGEQVAQVREEFFGIVLTEDGIADGSVVTGEGAKFGVVVRVREEAHVEEHVHVKGGAMLEAEGDQANRE